VARLWGRRVQWVGVVVVHDDGSTYAVELDGRHQLITYEFTTEREFAQRADGAFVEHEFTGMETVDIHIRGNGTRWEGGHWAAPRTRDSIDPSTLAIGSTDG